ncbi:hypothetical protein LTR10_023196 [Elasticomyces elasticus]|uniref:Uncharacterized protein n=1 Tax=Exophiala sideris TaxID=1016849 RepID=A0ABR0J2C5_9EURO|nr:hypothetical protein LTR10_023196 [Elasticomyces elasticus]KAK5024181.1 hypothetical protein LTS07_008916 [Exophiala sideris]KAK5028959.1 hypothetical protein LTR13_008828 [Exophiala sideris]KAK5054893.1 hypothetical protein LTR69_008801 [Exophiala sideris]KAK5178782.1 hypothetical protein LTR44_008609 [Eurotiomycetes sp. CCFEE 6388]
MCAQIKVIAQSDKNQSREAIDDDQNKANRMSNGTRTDPASVEYVTRRNTTQVTSLLERYVGRWSRRAGYLIAVKKNKRIVKAGVKDVNYFAATQPSS